MTLCFVGLGGNLGRPLETFRGVLELLDAHKSILDLVCSRVYRSSPVSDLEQPDFFNAVCRFSCSLSAQELFCFLEGVEVIMGKRPKPKNAPRVIDLDLLFYGELVLNSPGLILPHPRWSERLFVLKPLSELTERAEVHELLKKSYEGQVVWIND